MLCSVVFFVHCVCLRLVCPVFPVPLDCPFMIARSIFPNVNNLRNNKKEKLNMTTTMNKMTVSVFSKIHILPSH